MQLGRQLFLPQLTHQVLPLADDATSLEWELIQLPFTLGTSLSSTVVDGRLQVVTFDPNDEQSIQQSIMRVGALVPQVIPWTVDHKDIALYFAG